MSIVTRIPWIALGLIILSYSTLGWTVSDLQPPKFVWFVVLLTLLLLVGSLTAPYESISKYSAILLSSNTKTFVAAVLGAFLFFIMLAWFRVFLNTLLIISSIILGRIDFQSAGFSEGQTFIFTFIFSIAGIGLGALVYAAIIQRLWW